MYCENTLDGNSRKTMIEMKELKFLEPSKQKKPISLISNSKSLLIEIFKIKKSKMKFVDSDNNKTMIKMN